MHNQIKEERIILKHKYFVRTQQVAVRLSLNKSSKAIPLQAWSGPDSSRK